MVSLQDVTYILRYWLLLEQGCDASVLIASPSEKDHPDDLSLAGDGFDTVIKAKAAVDSDSRCTNKVSCADILALATRDVVVLVCGLQTNSWFSRFSSLFVIFRENIAGKRCIVMKLFVLFNSSTLN